MDKALLIKSVFFFVSLWGFTVAFLWFRPRIEVFWKIIATLIFVFYVWFFWDDLNKGYAALTVDWYKVTVDFMKELIAHVFVNLFFLWPVALIVVFYKADEFGAEKILKFMCILTIILWIVFAVYVYYERGIDTFLYKNLKEMIPDAKK